ncbi:GPP34 family phosphoprotein [Spirillospora sp. NPDC047279]|uniref:GOLPH3/VPS74 family protein n=1 Tax=Spirillospora sp. NPDC047279 TaxID=3155478 RepID=UPI003400FB9B
MNDTLPLADELLLLALREADGKQLIDTARLNAGLGGAVLAELALAGRVRLDGRRLAVGDAAPHGEPDLDAALARVAADRKPRKPEYWVQKLGRSDLRKRRLEGLAERGVLTTEDHKALGLFSYRRYPEQDSAPETEIRGRLQNALDGGATDDRTITLLAITHACGLDRKIFPGVPKKDLKRRIEKLAADDWAGAAVTKVIVQAVSAAVVAATVAATAASGG